MAGMLASPGDLAVRGDVGVPIYAYEISPQWPEGGGDRASIGAGVAALFTAVGMLVWLTLYRAVTPHNESGSAPIKLYSGGRSDPLAMSLEAIYALARESTRLGLVLLFAFMCEHYPLFPHSAKIHDMDMFWLVHLALFIVGVSKWEKSATTDLLNREQTEEWKGWMQFSFLMYHYFSAHETYNAIRVMITCYVWMTGFGNFSFFYIKRDFGFVRVVQMLWRLNFLVLLLMMTQGTTYMLYYICPLHTSYFVLTYLTMYTFQSINHTKWALRAKLFVVGLMIFAVWEMDWGLFDVVFFFVPTTPQMGGGSGARYEWYFRTSLDRWSTFLGMIFALNYPTSNRWLTEAAKMPLQKHLPTVGIPAVGAVVLATWWYRNIFMLGKLEYNSTNAFFAPIPLLCYIFLRNMHPTLRQWYSPALHLIGKTTLETYLMQHHVWLTSNAKTLLVLVPGMPKINFLFVSTLYYFLARELYRLTMSMRGMFLPDNKSACIRNLATLVATFAGLGACAAGCVLFIENVVPRLIAMCVIATLLAGVLVQQIDSAAPKGISLMTTFATSVPRIAVVFAAAITIASNAATRVDRPLLSASELEGCTTGVSHGYWKHEYALTGTECYGHGGETASVNVASHCERLAWMFNDTRCGYQNLNKKMLKSRLPKDPRIALLGDSEARESFRAMNVMMGVKNDYDLKAHEDVAPLPDAGKGVAFYWAPKAQDVAAMLPKLMAMANPPDIVYISVGLWDILANRGGGVHTDALQQLGQAVQTAKAKTVVAVATQATIVDGKLNTDDKKSYMNNAEVVKLNTQLVLNIKPHFFVDFARITAPEHAQDHTADGVRYIPSYYTVAMQQLLNGAPFAAELHKLGWDEEYATTRAVGGMYHPELAMGLLFVVSLMLVTFDVYGGATRLSAALFASSEMNENIKYETAYHDVLKSIDPALVGETTLPRTITSSTSTVGSR